MSRVIKVLVIIALAAQAAFLAVPAQAQEANGCDWGCNRLLTDGTIKSQEEYQQCLTFCGQVHTTGIEGFSIACSFSLPKACGYELAWDFVRYCLKPCAEFNEHECGKCLAQHSYCHKGTACRAKVCDCIIKNNCDEVMKNYCDHK